MGKMKLRPGSWLFVTVIKTSVAEINGIKIPFLHINHLLDNKKAINRPKDKLDIFYLEKIKKLREES